MKKHFLKSDKAFTLIELLVVVAIIGILSSVVIASLSSAREKGKIALIKSTLKQLYNQASLNQLDNGSFTGSNDGNLNCTGTGNNLAKIVQPLIDKGIVVKCFSYSNSGLSDIYLRFGATALIYDTNELKAWSVDENGVVKWDLLGVNSSGSSVTPDVTIQWKDLGGVTLAQNACAKNGGRLPSIEQSRTLSYSWYSKASIDGDVDPWAPVGFRVNDYSSSVVVPSSSSTLVYGLRMTTGDLYTSNQTSADYIRCVR